MSEAYSLSPPCQHALSESCQFMHITRMNSRGMFLFFSCMVVVHTEGVKAKKKYFLGSKMAQILHIKGWVPLNILPCHQDDRVLMICGIYHPARWPDGLGFGDA